MDVLFLFPKGVGMATGVQHCSVLVSYMSIISARVCVWTSFNIPGLMNHYKQAIQRNKYLKVLYPSQETLLCKAEFMLLLYCFVLAKALIKLLLVHR